MHRSRLCHFVIDVPDLDQGVAFWSAALNATEETVPEQSRPIYRRLRLPDSEIRILLQKTGDEKTGKERMHLDLEADDVEAEVSPARGTRRHPLGSPGRTRLRFLGPARPVGQRILRPPARCSPTSWPAKSHGITDSRSADQAWRATNEGLAGTAPPIELAFSTSQHRLAAYLVLPSSLAT